MNSRDEQWWILQAGEYVLGTLPATERATFEKLLQHDAHALSHVTWWENRFSHLDTATEPVTPPAQVWQNIINQLEFDSNPAASAPAASKVEQPAPESAQLPLNQHSMMGRRVTLWRGLTGIATAASLLLGTIFWQNSVNPLNTVQPAFDVISVVSGGTTPALWVIDAAPETKQLRVTAIAPPELESGKAFELWVVKANDQGVASMGLLPVAAGESIILEAQGLVSDAVAFAVSLEPEGGSPGPAPSGPVLYQGTFQKVSNPASITL